MDLVSFVVSLCCLLSALTTMALAIPLLMGKVDRNAFYGIHLPEAFESEEAWRALNRYGAERLLIWSAPVLGFGIVALVTPLAGRPGLAVLFGLTPLLILGAIVQTVLFARRYHAPPA